MLSRDRMEGRDQPFDHTCNLRIEPTFERDGGGGPGCGRVVAATVLLLQRRAAEGFKTFTSTCSQNTYMLLQSAKRREACDYRISPQPSFVINTGDCITPFGIENPERY